MEVILVNLCNIQEYIFDNINHLKKFNNTKITVLCDEKYIELFLSYNINIVSIESLLLDYNAVPLLNKDFRNGFWFWTSYRFKVINEYMKKYNVTNIIHIENDVLVYKDLAEFTFPNDKILLTMDHDNRCIPGLMFIPNYILLDKCLSLFNDKLNDMENWAICYKNFENDIDILPIFNEGKFGKNFNLYKCIFDAAAIGQYLGGVDPRNIFGDTTGFINETCVINYSLYKFIWIKNESDNFVPHIIINDTHIPIVNLHIHCKNLQKFSNYLC